MTTASPPIHTFQDLLDALEQDPRLQVEMRRHILDQEFLQLPSIVRELAQGQSELRQAVAENTAAIAQNTRDIAKLSKNVARLADSLARISGKVDNLNGSRYEQVVADVAPRFVRRAFGMVNAVVQHRGWKHGALLQQVADSDRLTDREAVDLLNVDVVISGQLADGVAVYVVGEISLTVQERDIIRVAQRARLLKTALDDDTAVVHAAAFGDGIGDDAAVMASGAGVHTIVVPDYGGDSG